ncbi:MAG TPA: GPR endopeptidase [Clostridiales bacterium]|nr:GPR endopeptidase [Clostridiales bacterium]
MRKIMNTNIRTDLALEVRESFAEDDVEIRGVILTEEYDKKNKIRITNVVIKDQHGAKAMGKPIGTYITIEAPELKEASDDYHKPVSEVISKNIIKLIKDIDKDNVLIVGLGNREVTPDALGPYTVDNLFITRHLIKEYGDEFRTKNHIGNISAISPGVMGQTGMETSEIIKGIMKETKPDLVIVIDALASRSIKRVNTTIQLSDTGICPGSGVGNNRKALNEETLGTKVIALGVPTVVDAMTIVVDTLSQYMEATGFEDNEINQFTNEIRNQSMDNMFVTPKDIDEAVKRISYTISEAINACFSKPIKRLI